RRRAISRSPECRCVAYMVKASFGAFASLFIEVPRWRDAYGGRGTVVALMGTGTVLIDNNRIRRRASPAGDRAQPVNAGFLLVTEAVVVVGHGGRVASADGARHWTADGGLTDGAEGDARSDP